MSIRLQMTLFYTGILVLTLTAFSSILYVSQDQYTLSIVKNDLQETAGKMGVAWVRFHATYPRALPYPWETPADDSPADDHYEAVNEYGEEVRQAVRVTVRGAAALDMVAMLDPTGEPMPQASGQPASDPFPISEKGMDAIEAGEAWIDIAEREGTRWLTLSSAVRTDDTEIGILQIARPLTDRDRSMRSLRTTLITGTMAATVIAFGAGWLLSGTTLRPIQRITETAHQIGEAQDLSSRVEYSGPNDEVGRLATTFNGMLERLDVAYQQIAHALQTQKDFVADVSHELRTPLTTIRGNLALLQHDPPLPNEEQADILEDLSEESARMNRLVNDLLTLARADAGRQLALAPLAVASVVEDVCRQAQILAPERTISAEISREIAAMANADALKQTLLILIDNAIKHGQGAITLSVAGVDRRVAIRVQDDGPGLSPELLGRIFDRFYRADAARSTPGFGLGLSIAKTLTEAQGGTVEVESTQGEGSTFTVWLNVA